MCNICVKDNKYVDCKCSCSAVYLYVINGKELENSKIPIKCYKCGHYVKITNLKNYEVKVVTI